MVSVSAMNGAGTTTAPLTIAVAPGGTTPAPMSAPMVNTPVAASGEIGQQFDYQIGASGNPTSYDAAGLPPA